MTEWQSFAASLVSSLAWPTVALIAAVLFRASIRAMISRPLSRAQIGPLVAEWEAQAVATAAEIAATPAPDVGREALSDRLGKFADASPEAAVLGAFAEIERALRRALGKSGTPDEVRNAGQLVHFALEQGAISKQTAEAIRGLIVLRNLAAHGRDVDLDSRRARDFVAMSDAVLFAIEHPPTQ